MNSMPNMENQVEAEWLQRVRSADPNAMLELQTAVGAKDPSFTVRSNPSPRLIILLHSEYSRPCHFYLVPHACLGQA